VDRLAVANRPRCHGIEGTYEVWYLTVTQPEAKRGFWLRYTTANPAPGTGHEPHSALWAAVFHRGTPERNRAYKAVHPLSAASYVEPFEVRVADSTLGLRGCRGEVAGPDGGVRWDLSWTSHAEPFLIPGLRWLRLVSAANFGSQPALEVSGTIEVDGEKFQLERAPGGQQHTWGRRHALEWNWGFASGFAGRGSFVDGVSTQVRGPGGVMLGGTALGVRLGERWVGVNSLPATVRQGASISPAGWDATVRDGRLTAEVSIRPRREDLIGVTYADPAGGTRVCYHTEVADLEVTLSEGGQEVASERLEGAAAFEYASDRALPGLPPVL
jgi:hypothetical protein